MGEGGADRAGGGGGLKLTRFQLLLTVGLKTFPSVSSVEILSLYLKQLQSWHFAVSASASTGEAGEKQLT